MSDSAQPGLAEWEATTKQALEDLRHHPGGATRLATEVANLREELEGLGVDVNWDSLTAYLHGFGQAEMHFVTVTGYMENDPDSWPMLRPVAVIELAHDLGILPAGPRG